MCENEKAPIIAQVIHRSFTSHSQTIPKFAFWCIMVMCVPIESYTLYIIIIGIYIPVDTICFFWSAQCVVLRAISC